MDRFRSSFLSTYRPSFRLPDFKDYRLFSSTPKSVTEERRSTGSLSRPWKTPDVSRRSDFIPINVPPRSKTTMDIGSRNDRRQSDLATSSWKTHSVESHTNLRDEKNGSYDQRQSPTSRRKTVPLVAKDTPATEQTDITGGDTPHVQNEVITLKVEETTSSVITLHPSKEVNLEPERREEFTEKHRSKAELRDEDESANCCQGELRKSSSHEILEEYQLLLAERDSDDSDESEDESSSSTRPKHRWSEDELWGFFKINEIEETSDVYKSITIPRYDLNKVTIKPIRKKWQELEAILLEDLDKHSISKFYVGARNDRQDAWRALKKLHQRFSHSNLKHEPVLYVAPVTRKDQTCCCETRLLTLARGKLIHQRHATSRCTSTSGYLFLVDTGTRSLVPRLPKAYSRMKYWIEHHSGDESYEFDRPTGFEERAKWEDDLSISFELSS